MFLPANIRIYLDIKRSIKNLLVVEPVLGNQTVLFNLNSEKNILANPKSLLTPALEALMQEYVDSELIRDFYVDLRIENTVKSRQEKFEKIKKNSDRPTLLFFSMKAETNIFFIGPMNLIYDIYY